MTLNTDPRSHRLAVFSVIVLALAVSVTVGQDFGGTATRDVEGDSSLPRNDGETLKILREGTKIDNLVGEFQVTGDRTTFVTDDGERSFVGLENLNLERVVRILSDKPEQLQWSVSGTITEYQGQNFLAITRAVFKSKTSEIRTNRQRNRLTSQTDR